MSKVLEDVMVFINENTNILIGICLFLIFVLVCYLIDNSIKTKKAKDEFEKVKLEGLLKEKEEQVNTSDQDLKDNKISLENIIPNINSVVNEMDNNLFNGNSEDNSFNSTKEPTAENFENIVSEDTNNSSIEDILNVSDAINNKVDEMPLPEIKDTVETDAAVLYKNDKKLSEILFSDMTKENQGEEANFDKIKENENLKDNLFEENTATAKISPKNVESKVEVELDDNELDNIMRKLKSVSGIDDEDNYTNIF